MLNQFVRFHPINLVDVRPIPLDANPLLAETKPFERQTNLRLADFILPPVLQSPVAELTDHFAYKNRLRPLMLRRNVTHNTTA